MLQFKIIKDIDFAINWLDLYQKWDENIGLLLKKDKTLGLTLWWFHGWNDNNVEFLKGIPWLNYLSINDIHIKDLSIISTLQELLYLKLVVNNNVKIDFSNLAKIRSCSLERWCSGFKSVFECNTLTYLSIYGYTGKFFNKISNLTNLRDLKLFHPAFNDLDGIDKLRKLKKLRIAGQRIKTIEHLHQSKTIENLMIQNCKKIQDIEAIANLVNLKNLVLENIGDIPTLAPISSCKKLEWIGIGGSTNILDGDLGFLLNLPDLKHAFITHRKHYSHNQNDFPYISPDDEFWRKPPKRIKI